MPGTDVLVVAIDTTSGWRAAADALVGSLSRAGASVRKVSAGQVLTVRTFALTDFVQARASRHAAQRGIAAYDPEAIVYCSMTAALLWPRPGAVWLDSLAVENRPGRHGVWQRPVERSRLRAASLVLAMSEGAVDEHDNQVVLPVPVEGTLGQAGSPRDIAAITYAGNPVKRRLAYVLEAWERVRRDAETLVVAGTDKLQERPGVRFVGRLAQAEYRSLLRRARVFVAAPRREDYGIAALEALADGCLLATTPAPGPYPALGIATQLDARLVDQQLQMAIRTALDDPISGYAEQAAELLAPYRPGTVDRTVAGDVLPRLLARWGPV